MAASASGRGEFRTDFVDEPRGLTGAPRKGKGMDENSEKDVTVAAGSGSVRRVLKIVLLLFALAVGGIVAAAWYAGDRSDLEMEYEGFD